MLLKSYLTKYVSGDLLTSDFPAFAITALLEGDDSPSLRVLAGRNATEYPSLLAEDFSKVLEEICFPLPSQRAAAIECGLTIANEIILGGHTHVLAGLKRMKEAFDNYDFSSETTDFAYDSIHFSQINGLFDQLENLVTSDNPWSNDKSNDEIALEMEKEILVELKKWVSKIEQINTKFN